MGINVLGVNIVKFELAPTVDPVKMVKGLFVDRKTRRVKKGTVAAAVAVGSAVLVSSVRWIRRPAKTVVHVIILAPVARAIRAIS